MLEYLVLVLRESEVIGFAIALDKLEPASKIDFNHLGDKLR
jgi:hypothetical protein